MKIHLHIERLVLDASVLGNERAGDVRAALERELGRLLTQPGAVDTLRGMGAISALPTAALPATTHRREHLGSRIASALQSGLGLGSVSAGRRSGEGGHG